MPDEFPTLEVVLFIGTLVALARTAALWSGLRKAPALTRALGDALRARDLGRARSLCDRSSAAIAARFGHALVEGLATNDGPDAATRSLERALARARQSVRRGHARDLAALALLVGAGAYAERATLGVGRLFYGLLAVALGLTVLGTLLRQQTLRSLVGAAAPLAAAAREAVARASRGAT
jgi:hypothetical protein